MDSQVTANSQAHPSVTQREAQDAREVARSICKEIRGTRELIAQTRGSTQALRKSIATLSRETDLNQGRVVSLRSVPQAQDGLPAYAAQVRHLIQAQEKERQHIARELHDQMGQYIAAVSMALSSLERPQLGPDDLRQRVSHLKDLTRAISREVHRISFRLRPGMLGELDLCGALARQVEEWRDLSGIEAEFYSAGLDEIGMPDFVETTVYRIVQEALTNVLKHAQARRVSVLLTRDGRGLSLVVEDNGRGFQLPSTAQLSATEKSMGLAGIRERAELAGGSAQVESEPGRGTSVYVRIPLPAEGRAE